MSPIPVENSQSNGLHHLFLIERRSKVRFPLELRVNYRNLGRGTPIRGEGWVVNMNRVGVLVSSQNEMTLGAHLELSIDWPSRLYGRVPLRFVAEGKVVRCDASSFAVTLGRYQFRTAKTKVTSIDACGDARGNARGDADARRDAYNADGDANSAGGDASASRRR
jgi:hypothetical protein